MAVSGVTGIALTKLDVLDGLEEIKICTGYRLNGRTLEHFPAHAGDQAAVEPIYERIEGWSQSTAGARSWAQLPARARSEEHTSELQSLMRISYAVFCLKKKNKNTR